MNTQTNELTFSDDIPVSVRLFENPIFKERALLKIVTSLKEKPTPHLFERLAEVYRKTGEINLAIDAVNEWKRLTPMCLKATYLYGLLNQSSKLYNPYRKDELQPARYKTIGNFLSDLERDYYWEKAIRSQAELRQASIGYGNKSIIDSDQRKAQYLSLEIAEKQQLRDKIKDRAAQIFQYFGMEGKKVHGIETKLTVYGEGDFFKIHQDGFDEINGSSRCISWIYYFHKTPKLYRGGDLLLFDSTCQESNHCYSYANYTRYIPQNNQILFFPSHFYHCVTPVHLHLLSFESSRFTIAGHIRCAN